MDVLHKGIEKLILEIKEICYKRYTYDENLILINTESLTPREPESKYKFMHLQLKLCKMLQIYAKQLLSCIKELYKNDKFCFINHEMIKQNNLDVLYYKSNLYKHNLTLDIILNINTHTIHLWNSEINWIKSLIKSHK